MAKLNDKLYNRTIVGKLVLENGDELGAVGEKLVSKFSTNNITSLSDDILNELKVGDVVQKITGNQKHCYIVTYKEEQHGICLSYFDCGYLETVSYDYTSNHWVYNSTDVCEVESVKKIYCHAISLNRSGGRCACLIFNNDSTPMTLSSFKQFIDDLYEEVGDTIRIMMTGGFVTSDSNGVLVMSYLYKSAENFYGLVGMSTSTNSSDQRTGTFEQLFPSAETTFSDGVNAIN